MEKELTLVAKKIAELATAAPTKAAPTLESLMARLSKLRMAVRGDCFAAACAAG